MKALQSYMDVLLANIILSENSLVKEFLDVDTINVKELAKSKCFAQLNYKDKLKAIVKDANMRMLSIKVPYQRQPMSTPNTPTINSNHPPQQSPVHTTLSNNSTNSPSRKFSFSFYNNNSSSNTYNNNAIGSHGSSFSGNYRPRRNTTTDCDVNESINGKSRHQSSEYHAFNISSHNSTSNNTSNALLLLEAVEETNRKELFQKEMVVILAKHKVTTKEQLKAYDTACKRLPISHNNILQSSAANRHKGETVDDDNNKNGNNIDSVMALLTTPNELYNELVVIVDSIADTMIEASPFTFISVSDIIQQFSNPNPPKLIPNISLVSSPSNASSGTIPSTSSMNNNNNIETMNSKGTSKILDVDRV